VSRRLPNALDPADARQFAVAFELLESGESLWPPTMLSAVWAAKLLVDF
jgi:hypothetical protein